MFNKKYKLLIVFYIVIISFLFIVALKDHKEQDMLEHFSVSMMKRKERRQSNAECKSKCETKYEKPEDIKVCKSYCKCKKRCNGDKKCIKKCKEIKLNIYRDDKSKLRKLEIKEKLKHFIKQEKKEKKKEQKKQQYELENTEKEKQVEKMSFVDEIIDKYFTDEEKNKLISTHSNVKAFYKDMKTALRLNKK